MKRVNTLTSLAVLLCSWPNEGNAQQSVSLSTGLDRIENPLLLSESPGGVTVLRIAPNYVFEIQSDRARSRFTAGAVIERSSNIALLANRQYPSLGYTWGYSWPTSNLELRATLAESSTRNSELRELGRVTTDSREKSVVTGGQWDQELTARTRLILNLVNTRVSFDSTLLEGYRETGFSSRFSWDATERTQYFLEPSHTRLMPSGGGTDASQTRWLLGTRNELSPVWAFSASLGQARVGGLQKSTGSLGRGELTYSGSRLSSGIEWSRDVSASGSASGYVTTRALGLRMGYRITQGASVSANLTRSESDGITGGRGNVFSVSLDNELSPRWTSTLGFEDRRSKDAAGVSGQGWSVRAGLVYAFPGR